MPEASKQKDVWDRFTALATILVPAAIALAGHFIAQGLKQAEISSEERRAEQPRSIAEANTKIAQAGLINTIMKSLTSSNPQERKLAVEASFLGDEWSGIGAIGIDAPGPGSLFVRMREEQGTAVAIGRRILRETRLRYGSVKR